MAIRQPANIAGAPQRGKVNEVCGPVLPDSSDPEIWDKLAEFVTHCHRMHHAKRADILFLYPDQLEDGFTVETDHIAYRVSFDRTRIVAIEWHNFAAVVLKERPELARAWRTAHSPIRKRLHATGQAQRFILDWLQSCVRRSRENGSHRLAI